MRVRTKVLAVAAAAAFAFAIRPARAGDNGTAAFEQLKSLAGHWETGKSNTGKATLDLDLTAGGTAGNEREPVKKAGKTVEMIKRYYLDGHQHEINAYFMAGKPSTNRRKYPPDTKTLSVYFKG